MTAGSFCCVNFYRENLGKNGKPAIYGGDDGFLNYDLLCLYQNQSIYLNPHKVHYHPQCENQEYANWKIQQNSLISKKLFGNNINLNEINELQADVGFFD
jgi:hypothetical protein